MTPNVNGNLTEISSPNSLKGNGMRLKLYKNGNSKATEEVEAQYEMDVNQKSLAQIRYL